MFEPLPAKFDFHLAEERVLKFWREHDIFLRSLEQRRGAERFVFYEGPPTANGLPHPGHCLTRAMKDLFPRYQTMCGKLVERKAGWDTHGLPVEVEVCKELGIHSKEEIETYGVEKFVRKCVESVWRYTREWESMTSRLGFWINLDEAYATYHQYYVESVWWSLKTLFDRGLLYQGHKVVWWWAQGGTALSAGEVGEGYREVDDPSVYVRFPLVEGQALPGAAGSGIGDQGSVQSVGSAVRTSLLVWTTTPWTLISNHFAAVNPKLDYALVHDKETDEYLYVAAALVEKMAKKVQHELEVIATCKGKALEELRYEPPFNHFYNATVQNRRWVPDFSSGPGEYHFAAVPDESRLGSHTESLAANPRTKVFIGWVVLAGDFVTLESGTGLVHEAPAYGEVDFDLLQRFRDSIAWRNAVPLLNAVAPNGNFNDEAPEQYRGRFILDCDKDIVRELRERGLLYHQETYRHDYPFCPRAEDDKLIPYARKSWFVRTSQFKDEFLKNNAAIKWLPEHIKEGRFGDFLRNNVDWALSRERFWGTPLPIWVCEQTGKMEAIGSFAELQAKPGATDVSPEYPRGFWVTKNAEHPEMPDDLRVHKPYIDEWTYESPFVEESKKEGIEGSRDQGIEVGEGEGREGEAPAEPRPRMRRVTEVIDCWWDAGSMPFAQWGFPHVDGSPQKFAERFPANFISEAIDQTRGWFYGLLAISTMLFHNRNAESGKTPDGHEGSMGLWPVRPETAADAQHSDHDAGRRGVASAPVTEGLTTRRRILPHWEAGGSTYFITFRTQDGELSEAERTVVLNACRFWNSKRMLVHAVVVMPDHAHLLCTPSEKKPGEWWSIADLMHSIKVFTAQKINELRDTQGHIWQQEYYDRIIRSAEDFQEKWNYVVENPARRGLPEDYRWVWVEPSHPQEATNGAHGPEAHAPRPYVDGGDYPMPYKACIVLGHMMGEDGLKMAKRAKNYKEPSYIFDHFGADAMRWYFFSAQAPWTTSRFEEANIRDAQREFLVRLYNVFSFFNIYANIDGFEARVSHEATKRRSDEGGGRGSCRATGWRAVPQRSELDRWIISELHRTILSVRESMDRFENYPAAGRLNDFVDALSNWYVRRSRVRFWRSEKDQDKWDAYNTLYEVLLTLSKLIAPFTPFFAETMYQNLTGIEGSRDQGSEDSRIQGAKDASDSAESKQPPARALESSNPRILESSPVSVHLCDYPQPDDVLIDRQLAEEMDIVRELVSLGHSARTASKIKVRQPLSLVEIILARHEHDQWLTSHAELIAEELNVKQVQFSTEADHYVSYQLKPNFKAIGPRFGKLAPRIAKALAALPDSAAARKTLSESGKLAISVDGQNVELTANDVEIRLEAKEGWSAAQGRSGVVVLKTEITPELHDECLVREVIHVVQGLRKEHDLAYEARITLHVSGPDEFVSVVRRFATTIKTECLAEKIVYDPPAGVELRDFKIEGHDVKLGLAPAT